METSSLYIKGFSPAMFGSAKKPTFELVLKTLSLTKMTVMHFL